MSDSDGLTEMLLQPGWCWCIWSGRGNINNRLSDCLIMIKYFQWSAISSCNPASVGLSSGWMDDGMLWELVYSPLCIINPPIVVADHHQHPMTRSFIVQLNTLVLTWLLLGVQINIHHLRVLRKFRMQMLLSYVSRISKIMQSTHLSLTSLQRVLWITLCSYSDQQLKYPTACSALCVHHCQRNLRARFRLFLYFRSVMEVSE